MRLHSLKIIQRLDARKRGEQCLQNFWPLCVLLAVLMQATEAIPQEPTPPQVGLTARCYFLGTIVLSWSAPDKVNATIFRTDQAKREYRLAHVPPSAHYYYDVGLNPNAIYQYRVKLDNGRTLGPVIAADSAEMLVGGDFESDELGPTEHTLSFHRAYGKPWWEIVELPRPESPGRHSVKIRNGRPPRRDGLHSKLFPISPRATYRQSGWQRVLPGSNALIGRRIVNRKMKPAGGRIVAYSYAPVILEKPNGWQYCEQRLTNLPKDAAYIQVWALASKSRNTVWFDDLSLIDERTERLAKFDSKTELSKLLNLATTLNNPPLQKKVEHICIQIPKLESTLRSPKNMPLEKYLNLVNELDRAVREATDTMWDLKILTLAK